MSKNISRVRGHFSYSTAGEAGRMCTPCLRVSCVDLFGVTDWPTHRMMCRKVQELWNKPVSSNAAAADSNDIAGASSTAKS